MINPVESIELRLDKLEKSISDLGTSLSENQPKPDASDRNYLTRRETAARLKVSLVTLTDWVNRSRLKAYKIGGRVLFRESEVTAALSQIVPPTDMVVLNSVNNLSKAIGFLKDHSLIHAFLDTDPAGRRALDAVQKLGIEVIDQSHLYRNFKNLNDYLLNHSKVKKQVYVPGHPEHDFHC